MPDIVTLDQVAAELDIDTDRAGAGLSGIVTRAQALVRQYCGRQFGLQKGIVEYHDVYLPSVGEIWVRNPPIVTLTSLYDDATTAQITNRSNRAITVASDVELFPEEAQPEKNLYLKLVNNEGYFSASGAKAVKVTYTGGYETQEMPAPVVQAVLWLVQAWYEGAERLTRRAQTVDGAYVLWKPGAVPDEVKELLGPYVRLF